MDGSHKSYGTRLKDTNLVRIDNQFINIETECKKRNRQTIMIIDDSSCSDREANNPNESENENEHDTSSLASTSVSSSTSSNETPLQYIPTTTNRKWKRAKNVCVVCQRRGKHLQICEGKNCFFLFHMLCISSLKPHCDKLLCPRCRTPEHDTSKSSSSSPSAEEATAKAHKEIANKSFQKHQSKRSDQSLLIGVVQQPYHQKQSKRSKIKWNAEKQKKNNNKEVIKKLSKRVIPEIDAIKPGGVCIVCKIGSRGNRKQGFPQFCATCIALDMNEKIRKLDDYDSDDEVNLPDVSDIKWNPKILVTEMDKRRCLDILKGEAYFLTPDQKKKCLDHFIVPN